MKQLRYRINDTFYFTPNEHLLVHAEIKETIEPMICALVVYLIENSDRPVERKELIEKFWGPTVQG